MADTITIDRTEYDQLLEAKEMLDDIEVYDRAMSSRTEGVPHAFVKRIFVDGEQPVLVYREWRGLTQAELARKAGLHRAQVHDIESGKRRGSVDTLKKIAEALRVPLDLIA